MDSLSMQITFLTEIDKMKNVLRQTLLMDKSRRENDAEHSWHVAMMALIFHEHACTEDIDLNRVIKMALVHDLIEIYAGDTFAYDSAANEDKADREKAAADKLFAILPPNQCMELRTLWDEFEAMQTPESLYVNAIDRFQPLLHNYRTDGHTWRLGNVTVNQVYARMEPIRRGAPGLWDMVEKIISVSIAKGYISIEKPV